jgi:hypothetical protein
MTLLGLCPQDPDHFSPEFPLDQTYPSVSPSLKGLAGSNNIWNALALVLPGVVANRPHDLLEAWRANALDVLGHRELDAGINTQECAGLLAGERRSGPLADCIAGSAGGNHFGGV